MQNRARTYTATVHGCLTDKDAYCWTVSSSDGKHEERSSCSYFFKKGAQTAGDYWARELTKQYHRA